MKNYIKLFGIITLAVVIGFSFLSCEDLFTVEDTVGTLTISGLSEFNGKNVIAYGYTLDKTKNPPAETPAFMAAKDLNSKREATPTTVSSGNASSMKVWKSNAAFNQFSNFNGTNQEVFFRVVCIETRNELEEANTDPDKKVWGVIGTLTVNFDANGTGTAAFTKGASPTYPY